MHLVGEQRSPDHESALGDLDDPFSEQHLATAGLEQRLHAGAGTHACGSAQTHEEAVDLYIPTLDRVGAGDWPQSGLDMIHVCVEPAHVVTSHPVQESM